jgi:UDPglucose 6-dehydrogenase
MINVGIIGFGFVGKAVSQLKNISAVDLEIYDPNNEQYNSIEQKVKAYNCDVIFINVPTNLKNGKLDLSIIDDCLLSYGNHHFFTDKSTIVIKSTVPVGTCRDLAKKHHLSNLVFNPEFLSERTAMDDFIQETELYLAGPKHHTQKVKELYAKFYDHHNNKNIEFFETENWEEVELLKLARNTFYGLKVSYCNHLFNLCERKGIDYSQFRKHFARGEWVGEQHTMVPGPDGKFGYGGKCLPKDSTELLNFCKKQDIMFAMLEESINFNALQRSKK